MMFSASFWPFREIYLNNLELKNEKNKKQKKNQYNTGINNLPDLVLIKIFNFLNFKERSICESVCKRWQSLAYIGVKDLVVSVHGGDEIKNYTSFNTFNMIIIPRIDSFYYIIKKSGRTIESLKIYGFQLKKKWLSSSKKEIQNFVDLIGDNCRKLKYLSIRKIKNLDEKYLGELLDKIGPNLQGFSYDSFINDETYNLIINKLNSDKLTDLTCLIDNDKVLKRICFKFKNLKNFKASFYKDIGDLIDIEKLNLTQCSITNHQLKPVNLIKLFRSQFNCNLKVLGLEFTEINSEVISLLSNFKCLETLKIKIPKQDDLDTICKTMQNLKRLVLSLTNSPSITQIRSIKNLKNLRSLEIRCQQVQRLKFENSVITNLKHLNLIGSSYFNERSNNLYSQLSFIFPNLISLKLRDKNQLELQFFKMLDELKRLKLLVVYIEQTSDFNKTLDKLKTYSNSMIIDLVLCKRKSEQNPNYFSGIRPLHYLEPKRSYNLPKTFNIIE